MLPNLIPLSPGLIEADPEIPKRIELGELVVIEWGGIQYVYNKEEKVDESTADG